MKLQIVSTLISIFLLTSISAFVRADDVNYKVGDEVKYNVNGRDRVGKVLRVFSDGSVEIEKFGDLSIFRRTEEIATESILDDGSRNAGKKIEKTPVENNEAKEAAFTQTT